MNRLYHVDAFTNVPFKGNPAAVCITQEPQEERWMMQVASEMNLSETAFLYARSNEYNLRWFTPKKEVSLCGHATLASAHILWEERLVKAKEDIHFHTMSGVLIAKKKEASIVLDFPARSVETAESNRSLNQALGITPIDTSKNTSSKGTMYLLELENEAIVKELKPDFMSLARCDVRGVIVTARSSTAKQDFVSRYFAPAVGIDEDPVTGSAHCYLASYWSPKLGKTKLTGYQASERGGFVRCEIEKDRVYLEGSAVTVFKAELIV